MSDGRCILCDRHGRPADLQGSLSGRPVWIVGGGASGCNFSVPAGHAAVALNQHRPGLHPDFRVMIDKPDQFIEALRSENATWLCRHSHMNRVPVEQPALFYHHRLDGVDPAHFFVGRYLDWGDFPYPEPGVRSVMFPALRLIHWMGGRDVRLVGCDGADSPYYRRLNQRLRRLAPALAANGVTVRQTNPKAMLLAA